MFYETSGPSGLPHDPFKACVVPRPIGWISTLDRDGLVNLAPFSFFNAVSSDPPMVMYCTNGRHSEGGPKDSLRNVRESGEFVANIATWELREQVNITSAPVGRVIDEMSLAALQPAASRLVRPPGVARSPVRLECRLHQIIELPQARSGASNNAVIGHVLGIYIDDSVLVDGLVDIGRLQPIARLGYMDYAVVTETFRMQRPASG
jgi:flavin reductase (DIM6/NTAB) family NADH-FMN oxidoreductase RutF